MDGTSMARTEFNWAGSVVILAVIICFFSGLWEGEADGVPEPEDVGEGVVVVLCEQPAIKRVTIPAVNKRERAAFNFFILYSPPIVFKLFCAIIAGKKQKEPRNRFHRPLCLNTRLNIALI